MNRDVFRGLGNLLRDYLDQHLRSIDEVLDLHALRDGAPGRRDLVIRERNAVLRAFAGRFYGNQPASVQARQIHAQAKHYAASDWCFDRDRKEIPPYYQETPNAYLWYAFKSGARMPISERQLCGILTTRALRRDAPTEAPS